ncbi:Ni/Fe-hydrogenase 1 B-type cytochrome subunit [Amycolatopsis lexingtonensis]|uniref:Ni/Fe-hydrogenase 1 B-type cytochrome subunit n=1 Tax=Amycolatopsis lexingtonensis TaxID=218822 RepID=A0ABR9HSZ3_9PSEU|nr:Ni/Fe-hydrogenase, b-type cytochrome subunit [Amycolatopsis lexingtonensis]MBE1494039.1 Ni/Fe-hydrogenase 1 B-type cytochrome subunit [Amycolatopsis lexingtonensis]
MTASARETVPEPAVVRVRVWDLPVRLIHWLLVLALAVLSVTGYLIGNPILALPASSGWVAWVKIVHKLTAYGFIALIGARVAWMFLSRNKWSRWTEWIPTTRERVRQIIPSVRFYTFLERDAPPVVGHNPLAGMTYTVLYLMFGVEIVTGVVLWGVEGNGWAAFLTGWLTRLFALSTIRFTHHLIMWLTWGFMVHHLYSGLLVDRVEGSGLMTSIFSGYKFLPGDRG